MSDNYTDCILRHQPTMNTIRQNDACFENGFRPSPERQFRQSASFASVAYVTSYAECSFCLLPETLYVLLLVAVLI